MKDSLSLLRGGGNFTRGTARRGNKRGRPPAYPEGTPTVKRLLILSDPDYALAIHLGLGNSQEGIRKALRACAAFCRLPPASAIEAKIASKHLGAPNRPEARAARADARDAFGRMAYAAERIMRAGGNVLDVPDTAWMDEVPT